MVTRVRHREKDINAYLTEDVDRDLRVREKERERERRMSCQGGQEKRGSWNKCDIADKEPED